MSAFDTSPAPEPVIEYSPAERQWAMFAHLSSLVAVGLGGVGILGPLIVWLVKKSEYPFVDDQGKEALNFHLNLFIAWIILGVVGAPLAFLTFGIALLLIIPLALALIGAAVILPIVAALKVNSGFAYRYPYIIRLVT